MSNPKNAGALFNELEGALSQFISDQRELHDEGVALRKERDTLKRDIKQHKESHLQEISHIDQRSEEAVLQLMSSHEQEVMRLTEHYQSIAEAVNQEHEALQERHKRIVGRLQSFEKNF